MLIGVSYFLKYAFDNAWISPTTRVISGSVAGIVVSLVGLQFSKRGYPLYGQDLSRERTPIEAGLRWACDLEGGGFTGAEILRRQAEDGTAERLGIFALTEPGIPRPGCEVLAGGEPVGRVTSGTLSPTLDVGIGMAYLSAALAPAGHDIVVDVRGKPKTARTERRPLVDTSPKKG